MTKAALGGTFSVLHEGHKELIDRAFELADEVVIGITTDSMASRSKDTVVPLQIRRKCLEEYLLSKEQKWEIFEIDDMFGLAVEMEDLDVLMVSQETYENGILVNKERLRRGLPEMRISVLPMVKNTEGETIRSSVILSGGYSRNGDRNAISIAVGSLNPVKTEAVRSVMEKIFQNVRIRPVKVDPGVPEQPWGKETYDGAVNRARAAMGDDDLSVGIEAGVFEMYDGIYDIQHCAVMDRTGRMTIGMSSGFRYPDDVAKLLRMGKTVGSAMKELYSEDRGKAEGAIGVLSKGLLDRRSLTEQSVIAAMVPRM